jgi:nitrogen fixation/metabolism regulation signal transduction histidine kinase
MLATVMILVTGSIFLVAYSVLHGLAEASQLTHEIFHSLDWVLQTVRGPIIISAAISLLASALIALVWSHRFAGPLRVLAAALARIGQGNLSVPVRIRKFDTHQDLVREFAQMQERLRERLGTDMRTLKSAGARLKAALPTLPEDHEARRATTALIDDLEAIASHYQL